MTVFKRMSYLCTHYVTADVYVIATETFRVSIPDESIIIPVLFLHLYTSRFAVFEIRCSSFVAYMKT